SYLSVFAQEKTPLEKIVMGEKLFLAFDPGYAWKTIPPLADGVEQGRADLIAHPARTIATITKILRAANANVIAKLRLERRTGTPNAAPKIISVDSMASRSWRFFMASMVVLVITASPALGLSDLGHYARENWPWIVMVAAAMIPIAYATGTKL